MRAVQGPGLTFSSFISIMKEGVGSGGGGGRKFTPNVPSTRASSRLNKNVVPESATILTNDTTTMKNNTKNMNPKRNTRRDTDSVVSGEVSGPFSQGPSASGVKKSTGGQRIAIRTPGARSGGPGSRMVLTQDETGLNRPMEDILEDELEASTSPRTHDEPLSLFGFDEITNTNSSDKEIKLSDILLIQLPQFANRDNIDTTLGMLRRHISGKYSIKFPNGLVYSVIESSFGAGGTGGGDRMKIMLANLKEGTLNDLGQITKHLACTPTKMDDLVDCLLKEQLLQNDD